MSRWLCFPLWFGVLSRLGFLQGEGRLGVLLRRMRLCLVLSRWQRRGRDKTPISSWADPVGRDGRRPLGRRCGPQSGQHEARSGLRSCRTKGGRMCRAAGHAECWCAVSTVCRFSDQASVGLAANQRNDHPAFEFCRRESAEPLSRFVH
jgi:hypothetical protein